MTRQLRVLLLMLLAMGPARGGAFAVEILAPAPGAKVKPGATVTVKVGPSPGQELKEVAFATSAGVTEAPAGTFQAVVTVPVEAVGPTFIVVTTLLTNDRHDVAFVEVNADPGPLDDLVVTAPAALDRIGQVAQVEVKGLFADGVVRDLTHPERGTTYQTSDATVVGLHPAGLVQARSRGTAQVMVKNRGKARVVTIAVGVPSPPDNRIPVPDAGPAQVVPPETLVSLTASASADPDGDTLQYHWRQESGRTVVLRDPETAAPYFMAPRIDAEQVLEFSLILTDSKGATSFPATVRITVRP